MTRGLALAALAWTCACHGRDARTARPGDEAGATAAPVSAAFAPATFAVAGGAWTFEPIGGATTTPHGIAVVDERLVVLLAAIGGDAALARRDLAAGAPWELEPVAAGTGTRSVIGGELAVRGGRPVMFLLEVDGAAGTVDVLYQEGGRRDVLARGCPLVDVMGAALIAADPAPVVAYACGAEPVIARRDGAAWKTVATLERVLARGAAAADGALVLVTTASGAAGRAWIVRGSDVEATTVPGISHAGDVVACGGRLHATFERSRADGGAPAFGRWVDGAWQLETITTEVAGAGVLGFDEACRPFVALGPDVWSRGRAGWVKTTLPSADAVRALAAHRGTLYATYTYDDGGIRSGVASTPLRDE